MRRDVLLRARAARIAAASLAVLLLLPAGAPGVAARSPGLAVAPFADAFRPGPARRAADRALLATLAPGATVARHDTIGRVRFLGGSPARPAIPADLLGRPRTPGATAARFLVRYGSLFGVVAPGRQLRRDREDATGDGRTFVRYRQVDRGVPVLGGELTIQVGASGGVISVHGELSPGVDGPVRPSVAAAAARRAAVRAVARDSGLRAADLRAAAPVARVWDPRIAGGPGVPRAVAAWLVDVRSVAGPPAHEWAIVDGLSGRVVAMIGRMPQGASTIRVCDQRNDREGAGGYGDRMPCSAGEAEDDPLASAIDDVRDAYIGMRGARDFYRDHFGRDGIADDGATTIATVRYCPAPGSEGCPWQNARWDADLGQLVFGAGRAADDIVGHEYTHGVTLAGPDLFYYYESGAISEALSDIFGEAIDVETIGGNDAPEVKWLIGEDLPGGAIRDMADPTAFLHPDRMGSGFYYVGADDHGGVHTNSGVANRTAVLIQDGGTFNRQTVSPLRRAKAVAIWYEVATRLLGSASDHRDLATALPQACRDLLGTTPLDDNGLPTTHGPVTAADCTAVESAVAATALAREVSWILPADAPLCTGSRPADLLRDGIDADGSGWSGVGDDPWYVGDLWAATGRYSLTVQDTGAPVDGRATLDTLVPLPSDRPVFLAFRHALMTTTAPDGTTPVAAVVELAPGPAPTWIDLAPLWIFNGYQAVADGSGGQPLGNRPGFGGPSRGFALSRANLGPHGGSSVRVRFRYGSPGLDAGAKTWFVDDVRIYTCAENGDSAAPSVAPDLTLVTGALGDPATPVPVAVVSVIRDPSGVAATDHGRRTGTGAWSDLGQASIASRRETALLPSGPETQAFRVQAQDEQGHWSRWRSVRGVVRLHEETAGGSVIRVRWRGGWGSAAGPVYSGGGARTTSAAGPSVRLVVDGATDLAWVSSVGPDRGVAEVWVDGALARVVDLYAPEHGYRQVVFATSFPTAGTHTLEVRPLGAGGPNPDRTRVDIDAFLTIVAP